MELECFKCKQFFSDIPRIFDHLKKIHGLPNNIDKLNCVVKNAKCGKRYMNFDSLRRHIKECAQNQPRLEVILIS